MFFDDYPMFTETSHTAAGLSRLNLRHEAMIAANRDVLSGARVLDIASHDERWSFAALKAGATHVTGVEARRKLVTNAEKNFELYGADPERYTFIEGAVFEVLESPSFEVDVVLCLGFLYHTWRLTELLSDIRSLDAEYLILDTQVLSRESRSVVLMGLDAPQHQGSAVLDPYGHNQTVTGRPSVPALQLLLETYDFGIESVYDWRAILAKAPDVEDVTDYRNGGRVTLRCRTGVASDPDALLKVSPRRHKTEQRSTAKRQPQWQGLANRALAKAIGYQLTRVQPKKTQRSKMTVQT